MAIVVFNAEAFKEENPEFENLSDAKLQGYFNNACLFLDNTDRSLVADIVERSTLLNLLVCHLATLGQRGTKVVGAMTSASEGSVGASFSVPDWGKGNWFAQTQAGLMFWQATMKYRVGGRFHAYHQH